jgi:hypothetical protein
MFHIHPVSVAQIVHRFNALGIEGLLKQRNRKTGLSPVSSKKPKGAAHQILQKHGLKLPENAIILFLDEKSLIPPFERTLPIPPLREGTPEQQTHDYRRHGMTNSYAALNATSGRVIGA